MRRPSEFAPVAATLREEVLAHPGLCVTGPPGRDTVDTNSSFVERRARPLAEIALARTGAASLHGLRLADLGCGFGALSAYFAFAGARVAGIDANAPRLEVGRRVAARHGLDVELTASRMEALDLPDSAFDVAVMNNSLCYLVDRGDRARALAEARRVLAPGGVLIVRNPNRLHPVDQFTRIPLLQALPPQAAVRAARALGRERSLCRLSSPPTARRELRSAGFAAPLHHPVAARATPRPKLLAQYSHLSGVRP